tara:strand:+ start:348 stop:662 length:315 start_codon:yes stop_codon:yes gene_type:complete
MDTLEETLPRHKTENPHNYDDLTLAKRAVEIKAACKDFPLLSENTIAMCWDSVTGIGEERMNEIILNKEWEKTPQKERPKAGVHKTVTIEDAEEPSSWERNVPK